MINARNAQAQCLDAAAAANKDLCSGADLSGRIGELLGDFWGNLGPWDDLEAWGSMCSFARLAPPPSILPRPRGPAVEQSQETCMQDFWGGTFAEDAAGYVFWRHSLGRAIFGFWGWVIRCSKERPGTS